MVRSDRRHRRFALEVVAVRAGLWQWSERGITGVPLIGIFGWAYFALGAAWGLERLAGRRCGLIVLPWAVVRALR